MMSDETQHSTLGELLAAWRREDEQQPEQDELDVEPVSFRDVTIRNALRDVSQIFTLCMRQKFAEAIWMVLDLQGMGTYMEVGEIAEYLAGLPGEAKRTTHDTSSR